jgi:heat shock protein HslJ
MKPVTLRRLSLLFTASLLWLGLTGCSNTPLSAVTWTLTGTDWKLTELNNAAVGAEKLPTLQIDAVVKQAGGFGGVNRYSGPVKIDGAELTFGPLTMTRMAGPDDLMLIETNFSQMLGKVTGWQIDGPFLSLLDGKQVIARFRATSAQR